MFSLDTERGRRKVRRDPLWKQNVKHPAGCDPCRVIVGIALQLGAKLPSQSGTGALVTLRPESVTEKFGNSRRKRKGPGASIASKLSAELELG